MAEYQIRLHAVFTTLARPAEQVKVQCVEWNNPVRLLKSKPEQLIFAGDIGSPNC